mmetsp:Transcript_124093/g.356356  ORF Transcript_124093/g.356356 Transcript_124093/m.356356 type:complete len:204 (+) Transcript_124093:454-1065(+)
MPKRGWLQRERAPPLPILWLRLLRLLRDGGCGGRFYNILCSRRSRIHAETRNDNDNNHLDKNINDLHGHHIHPDSDDHKHHDKNDDLLFALQRSQRGRMPWHLDRVIDEDDIHANIDHIDHPEKDDIPLRLYCVQLSCLRRIANYNYHDGHNFDINTHGDHFDQDNYDKYDHQHKHFEHEQQYSHDHFVQHNKHHLLATRYFD